MENRGRQPINQPVSAIPADRAHEVREQISRKYEYVPPGQLPLEKKNPDWTARWVRFRIKNSDDQKNVGMQRRDGYVPVPFEHRAEVLVDPDSVLPSASGNIEIGDVMLCRRSAERSRARQKYFFDKTQAQIRGAKNQVKEAEHQRYPGTISDTSTTSFEAPKSKVVEFQD